ncbi:endolytic transglycosylase MltG [Candidatus Saccharibacteria bacterium]|nr:endolytic transglycosylase MltG [Candidatus Saccharibacteria bacterium]
MRVLGLDVGEKRIGVAKADSNTKIAIPIGFIEVDGREWEEISHLAKTNHTNLFVLGLPRNNQGEETRQSLYVRKFAKSLIEKIPGARIRFQDESLTSVIAEDRLKKSKKRYQKGDIDAEAATIILQDFIENVSDNIQYRPENSLKTQPMSGFHNQGLVANTRAMVEEAKDRTSTITKKEKDKMILNSRKAKHKMKTATKWISGTITLVILALLAFGGVMIVKKIRSDERQEEYARLEAEMKAEVFNFTILPGETLRDIKTKLLELGYSTDEIEVGFQKNYDYDFLRERPSDATLEGYLYGNTHEFYKATPVEEILVPFLEEMQDTINKYNLKEKYAQHNLSLFEGITLASVVQKEASSPEQPTVAQVFLSRLSHGIPLGSDVTVSYAIDQIDPDRKVYTDNQTALAIDSCYNTRIHTGLPCGPIANPGLSALLAVAEPAETSYLYFLTGDDGVMYYSYTESEHIQNIQLHCQELCNVSL